MKTVYTFSGSDTIYKTRDAAVTAMYTVVYQEAERQYNEFAKGLQFIQDKIEQAHTVCRSLKIEGTFTYNVPLPKIIRERKEQILAEIPRPKIKELQCEE